MVGVAASAVLVSARRRTVILGWSRLIAAGAACALTSTLFLWLAATPGTEALRRGLLPMTAACSLLLVLGALMPTGPVAAISRARPIVWLGGISYALYLVHWPVIVIADRVTDDRSLLRSATIVTISVVLAQLSADHRRIPGPSTSGHSTAPGPRRRGPAFNRRSHRCRRGPLHVIGGVARRSCGGRGQRHH